MRAEVAVSRRAQDILGHLPGWGIDRKTTLTFHPHQERTGPERHQTAEGGTQPIGAGFLFGVLRADCDCLQSRGTMLNDPRLGVLQCRPRGFAQHGRRLEHLHGGRHRNLPRLREPLGHLGIESRHVEPTARGM
jgi:hypothetical protein